MSDCQEQEHIYLNMSGHDGKSRVLTFDSKQENYEEFEMQWNAFAQVEGFADVLLPNGHPHMPADHKTAITDEGHGEGKKQAWARRKSPRLWLTTLWPSNLQG
jgi:hypothetical protein